MAQAFKKQDMPPSGGYSSIQYKRIPAKSIFPSGLSLFGVWCVTTLVGVIAYRYELRRNNREKVEMRSGRFAIMPMLTAERDRAFLKHMRIIRAEEADLMKDVEGWKVGTLYGEPLFKTLPPDTFVTPTLGEIYAHSSYNDYTHKGHIRFYN